MFQDIRPISRQVFPGALHYSKLRRSGSKLDVTVIPELGPDDIEKVKFWRLLGLNEYVLARADKPHG